MTLGCYQPVFARPDLHTFDSAALSSTHIIHQVVPDHQHLQGRGPGQKSELPSSCQASPRAHCSSSCLIFRTWQIHFFFLLHTTNLQSLICETRMHFKCIISITVTLFQPRKERLEGGSWRFYNHGDSALENGELDWSDLWVPRKPSVKFKYRRAGRHGNNDCRRPLTLVKRSQISVKCMLRQLVKGSRSSVQGRSRRRDHKQTRFKAASCSSSKWGPSTTALELIWQWKVARANGLPPFHAVLCFQLFHIG